MVSIRYRSRDGRMIRETLGLRQDGWTKARALAVEAERLGDARGRSKATVGQLADEWFEDGKLTRGWTERTVSTYEHEIESLKAFHAVRAVDLEPADIQSWVSRQLLSKSPATVSRTITVLQQVLEYGVRHGHLRDNAARHVQRPKVGQREWRILTPEEIVKIDGLLPEAHRLTFRMLVRTGLRFRELQGLRVCDLDLERGTLHVARSKSRAGRRHVSLSPALVEELRGAVEGKRPEERVLKLRWHTYRDAFQEALDAAGVTERVRPFHDMRHTSLTLEAASGQSNPIALMTRAGHSNMKVTAQYLHLAGVVFPEQADALERMIAGG